MPSGSIWTSTSLTEGMVGADFVLHVVGDFVRSAARSSAGPLPRACPRKTDSPSCGRKHFSTRATPGMVSASCRIWSRISRSGARVHQFVERRAQQPPAVPGDDARRRQRRPVVRRLVTRAANERHADADGCRQRGDGVAAMVPRVGVHGGTVHRAPPRAAQTGTAFP